MKIFKYLILLICILFFTIIAGVFAFYSLNNTQQNRAVKFATNKILENFYPNIKVANTFFDGQNSTLILTDFATTLSDLSIKIPTLTVHYNFGYIKNKFDISFKSIIINNTEINQNFSITHISDWALQNRSFELKMTDNDQVSYSQENDCSIRLTSSQIIFDQCSFDLCF